MNSDTVRAAGSGLTDGNVEIVFRTCPGLDEGDLVLFPADVNEKFDGVLVAPRNPN